MMILGSSSSERAMATVWRCPPESEATTSRTLGMRAASSLQQRPGAHLHRHLVELPGAHLLAEEDVGDDVEVLAERQVLEDGGDAEVERVARARAMTTGRPSKRMVPELGWMHAGEDLDQRRLAGAVVADEGDDLAGMDVEVDVGERRYGAEVLGHALQAEDRLVSRRSRSWVMVVVLGKTLTFGRRVPPGRGGPGPAAAVAGYSMPSFLQPSA